MTKTLGYPLGILAVIILGVWAYFSLCATCRFAAVVDTPVEKAELPETPKATRFPFVLKDGGYAFEANDNFNFNLSSATIKDSLSTQVVSGIESLKAHFSTYGDRMVSITGHYRSDEVNQTAFPDLGFARANAVKNRFVALGIPSTRTALSSKLKEGMVAADSILYGPISFAITKMDDADNEKLQSLFDSITENPLVLYFETGQASISLDSKQRRKVIDIATFLDQVPGSQCTITGHTDNTGERTANVALGLQRAEFAKTYLVGNGIASDRILTASDGPDKPIASNATEEGKALNRRTVVTLKQ